MTTTEENDPIKYRAVADLKVFTDSVEKAKFAVTELKAGVGDSVAEAAASMQKSRTMLTYTAVASDDTDRSVMERATDAMQPTHNRTPVDEDWAGWDYFRQLQQYCRDNSVAKGFGKEGDDMRALAEELYQQGRTDLADQVLANYFSKRMNLIHDELAEAHEELRNGKLPDEEYVNEKPGKEGKPEGIPSELADVMIRDMDLSGEYEVDLAQVIWSKLKYNATRENLHGRRF